MFRTMVEWAHQWQVSIGMRTQRGRETSGIHHVEVVWRSSSPGDWLLLALSDTQESGVYRILTVLGIMGTGVCLARLVRGMLEGRITGVAVYLTLIALVIMENGECPCTAMHVSMTCPCRGLHRGRGTRIATQSQSPLTGHLEFTLSSTSLRDTSITEITSTTCTALITTKIKIKITVTTCTNHISTNNHKEVQ